eukprot:3948665-Prymnesium_polylepis.2
MVSIFDSALSCSSMEAEGAFVGDLAIPGNRKELFASLAEEPPLTRARKLAFRVDGRAVTLDDLGEDEALLDERLCFALHSPTDNLTRRVTEPQQMLARMQVSEIRRVQDVFRSPVVRC